MSNEKEKNILKRFILFIKEEWKFLVFLFILYLGLTFEFPYAIYTPGGAINMSERVDGKSLYEEKGSLSMTYVSMVKGTAPFLLLSKIIPNWDIVSTDRITYDDVDLKETVEIDKIYMQEAISNAEFVAYNHANIAFKELKTHNLITYVSKEAKTKLKYGDEIISIDGSKYTSLKEFQEYISTKSPKDTVTIEYIRDGKTLEDVITLIELENETKVGISIASISDYESDYDISVTTKSSESGPSGGFITALAIYNRLIPEDITKGLKIMGTGTIDKEGNVGEIGGVKYKLLGAFEEGADIFICPEENYDEAIEVKNEKEMDIIILSAKTFDEAIEKLKNLK